MAFTVSVKKTGVTGDLRYVAADLTFDNSYATGGVSLTAANLGIANGTVQLLVAAPNSGLIFEYDHTAKKLKAFYPTGGGTASPAALAAPRVTSGASTASAVDATQPNITPGQGKEVAASTDLSTVVTRVLAWVTGV